MDRVNVAFQFVERYKNTVISFVLEKNVSKSHDLNDPAMCQRVCYYKSERSMIVTERRFFEEDP